MNDSVHPVPFLPVKRPDYEAVEVLISVSASVNRFTNFGPVSRMLEAEVEARIAWAYPEGLRCTICSSATSGLIASAGYYALRQGRTLRWLVSAFSFFSTQINVFWDATLVDCDDQGCMDIALLEVVPKTEYDGIIVTNPFGLNEDLGPYFDLAAKWNKALIVDNAAGFGVLHRDVLPKSAEALDWTQVISFHHTKPHGIGEGGGIIHCAAAKQVFESLINFGVSLPRELKPFFQNGKISDFSCALILDHLRKADEWAPLYREQAERVLRLGVEAAQ